MKSNLKLLFSKTCFLAAGESVGFSCTSVCYYASECLCVLKIGHYLHEQQSYNECTPLTIADLAVNQRIRLR